MSQYRIEPIEEGTPCYRFGYRWKVVDKDGRRVGSSSSRIAAGRVRLYLEEKAAKTEAKAG